MSVIAARKGRTIPQVRLAWIRELSGKNGKGIIIPIPGAEREDWVVENCQALKLTENEMQELDAIIQAIPISEHRYDPEAEIFSEGLLGLLTCS